MKTILDRAEAVEATASRDRKDPEHLHIILIIGKGNERWFKDHASTSLTRATTASWNACSVSNNN